MFSLPYIRESPGSLTLKTKIPMEYSRAVLTNIWHEKRQAEPKDCDLNTLPRRNMQIATYKRLQNTTSNETGLPKSTTQDQQEEPYIKRPWYMEEQHPRPMIDHANMNVANAALDSLTNRTHSKYQKLLPRHPSDFGKPSFDTTYGSDFIPPYPYHMKTSDHSEYANKSYPTYPDKSWGYRKMISQFTDVDQPRRSGINTFHIQHGSYENREMRREMGHFAPTNPFPIQLE
ncbi:unnamed protein product [Didymodactylos carnosus]|uniref:Uncharacterized protein n=1 Tax=Didymodactylos carnosus TaxID=1234261 RepID=A0A814HVH0_9BILA|nr:unnamed protein product [Didymodactylos carnosus]CAF1015115.1 unnamed protein product [Didymodactylos carnosus]CAF3509518.1 unnamed protein product [Didymodactylos carnosus]CAF3786652.1 unnamed protein product [Didymodactylos carnosus]